MNNFIEYNLGKPGLDFVQDHLAGWTGLTKDATCLPIQDGKAFAILPSDTPLNRALGFSEGGVHERKVEVKWIVDHFMTLKRRYDRCSLVVQHLAAKPSDTFILKCSDPMFFHQGMVYFYLDGNNFTKDSIIDTLYHSVGFHFVTAFFLKCGIKDAVQKQEIPDETYRSLLENIVEIYIHSYDAEGHIIWTPNK